MEDLFLKKAPALPAGVKEFLVQYGPWIALVFLVLSLPMLLALLGMGSMLGPLANSSYYRGYGYGMLAGLIGAVVFVMQLIALPGLFKRQMSGWKMMYWATWVSIIGSIVSFNILGAIISFLISFYILFQIRSYYK